MRTFGLLFKARPIAVVNDICAWEGAAAKANTEYAIHRRRRRIIRPEKFLETAYKPWYPAFSLRALHRFTGRCIVGCEGKGGSEFSMSCDRVATMGEELTQLDVHLECRGVVGFGGGGEISAQECLGEFRRAVGICENAGGVDEGWTSATVASDARLESVDHLVGLVVALVEVAKVNVGLGSSSGSDSVAEF
jgi:hypothetical protein